MYNPERPCAVPRHARGLKRPQGSFLGAVSFWTLYKTAQPSDRRSAKFARSPAHGGVNRPRWLREPILALPPATTEKDAESCQVIQKNVVSKRTNVWSWRLKLHHLYQRRVLKSW